MPIQTNTAFDVKNTALFKQPIYVLQIEGQATVYSTSDLAAAGATSYPTYKPWLKTPAGATQSVDVLNGTATMGTLSCEVTDFDGSIRTLIGGTTLAGKQMVLYVGYPGLTFSATPTPASCGEYVALHAYGIYQAMPSDNFTSGIFNGRDPQQQLKVTIYANPYNGALLSDSNPLIVQGTPSEIVQCMVLFVLGLPSSVLNIDALHELDSAAEGMYESMRPFLYLITGSFEVKNWLESELFKLCGAYPFVDNLGRIGIKAPRPPAAGISPTFTFSRANMLGLPKVTRMPIINQFVVDYDADASGGGFGDEFFDNQGDSLSQFGFGDQQWSVQSDGLRQILGATTFLKAQSDRIFRRFSGVITGGVALRGGACAYDVVAQLMTLPVQVGDYVYLTRSDVWDLTTGALGVMNRVMEVINRKPDYTKGRMSYQLLDTGLTGLQAAKLFSPSGNDFLIGSSLLY